MITAKIQYTGKRTGLLASFYQEPKVLGKYETEEEVNKAYNDWLNKVPQKTDWKLILD